MILTLLAVTEIAVLLYFVGDPIFGKEMATIASPVLAGGAAATLIITSELENLGLGVLPFWCSGICYTKVCRVPLASVMLKKEAKRLLSIRSEMDLSQELKAEITPLLIALGLGVLAVILVALILAKVFKLSKAMAISIGAACFFGFPTTYYIPHEVATTLAKNEEEKEFILDQILPKMHVAGFLSVTLVSVILAGLMVDLL